MADNIEQRLKANAGAAIVAPDASTVEAFQIVARSLLGHIASHAESVRDLSPKGVHRTRVALRRLRAAISVFAALVGGEQTERVKVELRWLTARLGPARDLDVLTTALNRRCEADAGHGHKAVVARLSAKRATAFANARKAVASRRFRTLLRDVEQWVDAGDWLNRTTLQPSQQRARRFARTILARRTAKVVRRAKQIDKLDITRRHRLRIAIKKLYYAIEFFHSLFTGDKQHQRLALFGKRLKRLLGELGALNDTAVQRGLLAGLTSRPRAGSAATARQSRQERDRIERLLESSARHGRKLARARTFRT